MNIRYFTIGIFLSVITNIFGQDPQFSQYYSAPLNLNPGFTGMNQLGRMGLNYRNQWPSIDANFESYSFYVDYNFDRYSSSVGLIVNTDREGLAGLRSNMVGLQYAYQFGLNYKWTFRPAVQVAYYMRDINFEKLTFGDQFDPTGQIIRPTSESFGSGLKAQFFDVSFGGVFFNERVWGGISVYHVTEPNQALAGGESPLYQRTSIHGGYKIHFYELSARAQNRPRKERSFSPTFNFRSQGVFDQLDVGAYINLEPVIFGLWYRGVPIKNFKITPNNESFVFMVGLQQKSFNLGYSFDFTISDLGINSGGAHEISFIFNFDLADPSLPPKSVREVKCPVPFSF